MDFSFLDGLTQAHMAAGDFPSAVVRVFDGAGTLFSKAYGGVDEDAWFDMASVSKLFTTTMILSLMDEGRLSPESPAARHLPEGRFGSVTRQRLAGVTLRQLMTHTSGILPWFPFYCDGRDFWTVLERALAGSEVQPGMVYSDLNFMLLAQIFTYETGLSLREGLERYVKAPLGISQAAYGPIGPALACPSCYGNDIEQEMCAARGLSYGNWRPDGVSVRGACNDGNAYYYFNGASGHAGIFATASAMEALGRFYLNTSRPIFLEAMEADIQGRGLGFDRGETFPGGCGHSGFTGTSLWVSRTHQVGAVLLTNRLYNTQGRRPVINPFRKAVHEALCARFPQ